MLVCSDYYVPYCIVTLASIAQTSNPDRQYTIIIMTDNTLSDDNKKLLLNSIKKYNNIIILFFNAELFLTKYDDYQKVIDSLERERRFTPLLMCRVFSPFILSKFKKYIWLDCDVVVKKDIGLLFDTDLKDNLVGGVHDIIFNCFLNGSRPEWTAFYKKKYKMKNSRDYINAGVILMNAEKYRQMYSFNKIIKFIKETPFAIFEQDVFNVIVEGYVLFIDEQWNCFTLGGDYIKQINYSPARMYHKYKEARNSPAIIHYAGDDKPWNNPATDMAYYFWQIARETMAYEILIARMIDSRREKMILSRKFLLRCIIGKGKLYKLLKKLKAKLTKKLPK